MQAPCYVGNLLWGGRVLGRGRLYLTSAAIVALVVGLAPSTLANETKTYIYDARGRLVKVDHGTTGPNANIRSAYQYDNAGNRTNASTGTATAAITLGSLPNGTVGTAYSATISASGGTNEYTFAKTAGTLPTGLALSSAGALTGTPTNGATYNFTIQAKDDAGNTGSRAYSLVISTAPNQPPVTTSDTIGVMCNSHTTLNVTSNDTDPEGNYPLTVTAVTFTSNPVGAEATIASASTLNIYGGIGPGTSTATYTVEDSLGASSTGTLTINTTGTRFTCVL